MAVEVTTNTEKRPFATCDFSLSIATVNGTGSQTANMTLLRALFKMGIPVSGKNIFPSNIQGQPTWFYLRVSRDAYQTRQHTAEILVTFNQATIQEDVQQLPPGGVCVVNGDWKGVPQRDDLTYYAIPVNLCLRQGAAEREWHRYMANMVYVGALAQLLGIHLDKVEEALTVELKGRLDLVEKNMAVVQAAYNWTAENITKVDSYCVEPMNKTSGQILITGNEAAALGAIFGGVTLAAWYPITPATSLIDALNTYLPQLRRDPDTGRATYAVVQAEDELAAMGMVLGAGWAGARAMTATSGPGISLMAEFAGLGYFAEIPAVVWDIQRVGPSTGLPTRTSQGDVRFAHYLGHGDARHVILLPATVQECFQFGTTAFNLAEELQTPVFVLSDLDLGMNVWMSEPFVYPKEPIRRGKVLTAVDVHEKGFARYKDVDGDGIPYRTLPGNKEPGGAWFARGSGHDEHAAYSEKPDDWCKNMARLARKLETARDMVPGPLCAEMDGAAIGIIGYGSTLFAIDEARHRLAAGGIKTSFMRLRALPVDDTVRDFVQRYRRLYVVEMNQDGQMHAILQTELPDLAPRLISLSHIDGLPLTVHWICEALVEGERAPWLDYG